MTFGAASISRRIAILFVALTCNQCTQHVADTDVLPESNQMHLKEQLNALAAVGIVLNQGVRIEDLTTDVPQSKFEANPFSVDLILTIASDLGREPFTPIANGITYLDYECIDDDMAYAFVIERLELMTGKVLGLANFKGKVDFELGKAWVEFTNKGKPVHWDAKFDEDWLDHQILVNYNALLAEAKAPGRIYTNQELGQASLLVYFTPDQAKRFNSLGPLKVKVLE